MIKKDTYYIIKRIDSLYDYQYLIDEEPGRFTSNPMKAKKYTAAKALSIAEDLNELNFNVEVVRCTFIIEPVDLLVQPKGKCNSIANLFSIPDEYLFGVKK